MGMSNQSELAMRHPSGQHWRMDEQNRHGQQQLPWVCSSMGGSRKESHTLTKAELAGILRHYPLGDWARIIEISRSATKEPS